VSYFLIFNDEVNSQAQKGGEEAPDGDKIAVPYEGNYEIRSCKGNTK
jgi:hypothetical protein